MRLRARGFLPRRWWLLLLLLVLLLLWLLLLLFLLLLGLLGLWLWLLLRLWLLLPSLGQRGLERMPVPGILGLFLRRGSARRRVVGSRRGSCAGRGLGTSGGGSLRRRSVKK